MCVIGYYYFNSITKLVFEEVRRKINLDLFAAKNGCGTSEYIDTSALDNNAWSSASVCEIDDAMDKKPETVLKNNFQNMTDYVIEFTSHLLEEIKYFGRS